MIRPPPRSPLFPYTPLFRSVRGLGGHVYWADTAEDARRIVTDIARKSGARRIVKSKSMTTEEVHLNPALQSDRKSTRLNSSHGYISYAVFCLKKKTSNRSTSASSRSPNTCAATRW